MKSCYLNSDNLPAIDKDITNYIEEIGEDPWGSTNCYVGIQYNNVLYRRVACEGLTEWVGFEKFLWDLNLTKLDDSQCPKGYDSVFVIA
ncbi:TPA: hypothetical protein QB637_000352 [Pasteurella multocida]|nr:hypothetical protein [Pasteurella multocida]HED4406685.1 hypothetical protein [Pasteurella multocida]